MTAERADLAPTGAEPNLADSPGLRVVPPLRPNARALPDWLVAAAVGGGVALGVAISVAGVFGVAAVVALAIVGALVRDEGPKVWRRTVRRRERSK